MLRCFHQIEVHHFNRPKISNNSLIRDQKSNKHIANGSERSSWTVDIRLLIMEMLNLFLQRWIPWFKQKLIRATCEMKTNVQILERDCISNQYQVRKSSIYKRSRLTFLTVCFMLASHPRKVNRLTSDQRRKCTCAARGFRAEQKRGFELVVPRRLSLQWHLILGGLSSKRGRTKR